ncbi:hypothetical protein LEP1GSC060_3010 [Leptospira weilii serovar Ranarum str. ICFT]|uniref:Uncharacterized protein n=1 Tax=Leptospira weilii serovar Ranarum str. ICFT TaxID=1218598 RepID=N1WAY7_9LEPT|nr:hypothetical protein LEP1GSC060_3010 [Leptospira weilii serovar Ranarum str. ICFT]
MRIKPAGSFHICVKAIPGYDKCKQKDYVLERTVNSYR